MTFEVFQDRVLKLLAKVGGNFKVAFQSEDGRHYARVSDGTTIIGNSDRLKVTVKWGSGHTAMATI